MSGTVDVGLVATVVGSAAAVAAVGVALWQGGLTIAEQRRQRLARQESANAPAAPRTGIDQSRQQVWHQVIITGDGASVTLGPSLAPQVEAPRGAGVTAPLGSLPAEVRGRDAVLSRLRARLTQGGLVVLAGPGGVGKSTIARELIRRMQAEARTDRLLTWWLSGTSQSTLSAGLVSVAQQLGASERDLRAIADQAPDGPDRLWRLLEEAPSRWLLVIDNADDPERLAAPAVPAAEGERPVVPRTSEGTGWARSGRRGLVLVTSRQRSPARWGAGAGLELVGVLNDQQAAQVLVDLAPAAGDWEQAEALARRLGRLPLALHVAGSYVSSEFARWRSFADYRQALDQEPASALNANPEDEADERATLTRTWELSLDDLAKHGISQARALLRLLSCYAPALAIPYDLLDVELLGDLLGLPDGQGGDAPMRRLEVGLRGLSNLGLIEAGRLAGDNELVVVVHPVIAAGNRAVLASRRVAGTYHQNSDPEPVQICQAAIALLERNIQTLAAEGQALDSPRMRRLAPHVIALLDLPAAVGLDQEHRAIRERLLLIFIAGTIVQGFMAWSPDASGDHR